MYICVLLLLIIVYLYHSEIYHWFAVKPTINTTGAVYRDWNVISRYSNSADAANMLSRLNSIMIEFMRVLEKKYHINEPEDVIDDESHVHVLPSDLPNDTYNQIAHMIRNYNPDEFYENDPQFSKDTSYTIGKGQQTHFCLRDKDNPDNLIPENVMLFVMLHEAAHMANYNDIGHNKKYWEVFKLILHEAVLAGIYEPVDYAKYPVMYCGLKVDYQPLYDDSLANLWIE